MQKYTKGFSLPLVVVVVVVLGVTSFIAWRLTQPAQQQKAADHNQNTQQKNQEVNPNAGYVVIKEWGVRFKPVSNSGTAIYKAVSVQGVPAGDGTGIPLPDGSVAILLSTKELAAVSTDCDVNEGATGVWRLYRSPQPVNLSDKVSLGKIGDYYYYYFHAGAACVADKANYDLNGNVSGWLYDSFKSLELAQ